MLTGKVSAADEVEAGWESTIGQREAQAAEWDATMSAFRDAQAEDAAAEAAEGL